MPARRLAPGQEPLEAFAGDELEGLRSARRIQHGNHQPPVLRLSQPEGGNFLACKVRVGIRCGMCGLPELPGKFGGGHVLAGLPAP